MDKIKLGFALCGSFCTFSKAIPKMKYLVDSGYDVTPIMSFHAYETDTRFGKASDFAAQMEESPVIRFFTHWWTPSRSAPSRCLTS